MAAYEIIYFAFGEEVPWIKALPSPSQARILCLSMSWESYRVSNAFSIIRLMAGNTN